MNILLEQLIRWSGQNVIFPFYHLISDEAPKHTGSLFHSRTRKMFENDIKTFLNYFDPISAEDFIALRSVPNNNTDKYFLLSFDDGYSEVYEHALPILGEHDVPAIAFVNPAFVDNQQLFYRNKASLLLASCDPSVLNQAASSHHPDAQGTLRDAIRSADHTQTDLLDHIAQLNDIDFHQYLDEHRPYMTLDQIQELSQQGFAIGAHSMDHPNFMNITLEEQLYQAHASLRWVQDHIAHQPRLFAFPFSDQGISQSFFDQLDGDLSFGTGMIKKDIRTHHYQRLDVEKSHSPCHQFLLKEFIKYYLKMPLGKHKERPYA